MLRRKAYEVLRAWKNGSARKALLVTGARQIGKSYLIRAFARAEYDVQVEINLVESAQARKALAQARDAQDFVSRIAILSGVTLVPGRTLVFIDEVQELPDVMTMAKFLVEDGRFDWAFSGSMLGTAFKGVRSYPVGYVHEVTMRPLDYEEFCWAIGTSDEALRAVREACAHETPVETYVHEAMLANFRTYLVVGGMPEVVCRFVETRGDLASVRSLQQELNGQYRRDISKYAGSRALHVQAIFDELPIQLEKDSQRFMLSAIDPHARYEAYRQDFVWLVNAGVALKTSLVSEPKAPLAMTASPSKFKLYQSDTGMLLARYPLALAQAVYLDEKHVNLGSIYENAIAQELTACARPLYYYMTRKRGEVDFVVEAADGTAVPIEVKSGAYFRAHAALDNVVGTPAYGVERALVLSRGNVARVGSILYVPLYATFCLPDMLFSDASSFKLEVRSI